MNIDNKNFSVFARRGKSKFLSGNKLVLLFALLLSTSLVAETNAETKYVSFQVMTGLYGYAGPSPMPGRFSLSKAQLEEFVHSVVKAIGTTGDARHKLGFVVGPLCFDMSDEETRQFIHDAFAVARKNDVAVAFHIDDSISWGQRKDLLSNPDNIETSDWKQEPNTGRRADWGPKPTKFPPQMSFNSPDVQEAVKQRASLIGAEVKKELDALKTSGKEHLFAGIIAGWETQMGRFQEKMQRIQKELPGWVQKSGQKAQAMPLTEKLKEFMKDRKWQEADRVADALLSLMSHAENK